MAAVALGRGLAGRRALCRASSSVTTSPTKSPPPPPPSVSSSSGAPTTSPTLTRAFIAGALSSTEGYFHRGDVIAAMLTPLAFASFAGEADYRQAVDALYRGGGHGWLTPAELFQPHYGRALARHVLARHLLRRSDPGAGPLVVFEVGGGSGRAACDFLDHLRRLAPAVYSSAEYTILEVSVGLLRRQQELLALHGHAPPRARSLRADATRLDVGDLRDSRPCFVLGLEVLDNLPHDKVAEFAAATVGAPSELFETVVVGCSGEAAPGVLAEAWQPLSDPLIIESDRLWRDEAATREATLPASPPPSSLVHTLLMRLGGAVVTRLGLPPAPGSARHAEAARRRLLPPPPPRLLGARYVPTGCLAMLRGLEAALPRHDLVLADFDSLPPPTLLPRSDAEAAARGDRDVRSYAQASTSPLVSSRHVTGAVADHSTYLSARQGSADIFFPTDFSLLRRMVRHVRRGRAAEVEVLRQAEFLRRYAETAATATRTGFNPLLDDFPNAAVLTTASASPSASPP